MIPGLTNWGHLNWPLVDSCANWLSSTINGCRYQVVFSSIFYPQAPYKYIYSPDNAVTLYWYDRLTARDLFLYFNSLIVLFLCICTATTILQHIGCSIQLIQYPLDLYPAILIMIYYLSIWMLCYISWLSVFVFICTMGIDDATLTYPWLPILLQLLFNYRFSITGNKT